MRSEVRGQRSEVRGQRSEVRGQRSEVRGQRSEVRGQRSLTFYPVHFAPVFSTCITFANRRFFVSSCFALLIELAISFLCVNASFSHRSCAFLFLTIPSEAQEEPPPCAPPHRGA